MRIHETTSPQRPRVPRLGPDFGRLRKNIVEQLLNIYVCIKYTNIYVCK